MKKLLLMVCAISAMNVSFGMDSGQEIPTPFAPEDESVVHRFASEQRKSAGEAQDMLEAFLVPEDKKRIDEPTHNNNNAVPAEKPNFASDKLSQLFKIAHAHAPKRMQMVMDQAAAHPQAAKALAFAAAEGCSWWCYPNFHYAANLVLAGWASHILIKNAPKSRKKNSR